MTNEEIDEIVIHEFETEIRGIARKAGIFIVDYVKQLNVSSKHKNMIVYQIVSHMKNSLKIVMFDEGGINKNFEDSMGFEEERNKGGDK